MLCALLGSAAGCAPNTSPDAPRPGGTLTIAQRDSFATFDPAFAWNPEDTPYLGLVFEGLVAFDDSGRVRPACAARTTVSDGGLTYRFDLRKGLKYADGSRIDAQDFVSGLKRLFRAGALRSPGAPQFVALSGALHQGARSAPVLGVEAPEPDVVMLRLAWPDPHLLEKLAQPRYAIPVPESASARLGPSYGAFPSTNGAYRIERAGRDTLLFVRSRRYDPGIEDAARARAQRGYPDTIRVLTNRTARQTLLGLESGRVDLACPPPLEYGERLERSRRLRLERGSRTPPVRWFLALNCELAPLARRDARRGAAWGINRQRLVEELGAYAAPSRAFADREDAAGHAPGYDPVRARQFLEAAKYYTGIRIAVTVPRASKLAAGLEALTPSLARASIQVDGLPRSIAEWSSAVIERRGSAAALLPWQAPAADDLEGLASMFLNRGLASGWAGNVGWYRPDDGLDSLLLHGLRETDPLAREAARDQVGTILESDLPVLPLARIEESAVLRAGWTGARFHIRSGLDLRRIHRRTERPTS